MTSLDALLRLETIHKKMEKSTIRGEWRKCADAYREAYFYSDSHYWALSSFVGFFLEDIEASNEEDRIFLKSISKQVKYSRNDVGNNVYFTEGYHFIPRNNY